MKAVNNISKVCQILALVFSLSAIVLFFMNFARVVTQGEAVNIIGAQLAFGTKASFIEGGAKLAKSSDLLFCFILSLLALVTGAFTFKSKGARFAAPAFAVVSAIYMLVIALSNPWKFVDVRPLQEVSEVTYAGPLFYTVIALFAATVFGIAYLLLDDYVAVANSKGSTLTIPKRVVRFFKDYKSEIKKIVWPGPKSVVRNTIVVLAMCAVIGLIIWLVDFGLLELLSLIWGV